MNLPFSPSRFFEVFTTYNHAVWPAQYLLLVGAVALVVMVVKAPHRAGRVVSAGLAILWAWMAIAYHLAFFWVINPAAPVFAGVSLGAAAAFAWQGGLRRGLEFGPGWSRPKVLGALVILFALAGYPFAGELAGHRYPAAPTFGLPCPTTHFTFGILLMAKPPLSRWLIVGPLLWAIVGSTAAFALGVVEDLALVVVAIAGVWLLVRKDTRRVTA